MSYSDNITIYTKKKKINFDKVASICNKLYKPKLKSVTTGEPIKIFKKISTKFDNYKRLGFDEKLFIFYNHDGVNDEEIAKCFKLYCKVCNYTYCCLIQLESHATEPLIKYIWNEDNELYTDPKNMSDEAIYLSNYFKKLELESELEELKDVKINDINKFIEQ